MSEIDNFVAFRNRGVFFPDFFLAGDINHGRRFVFLARHEEFLPMGRLCSFWKMRTPAKKQPGRHS